MKKNNYRIITLFLTLILLCSCFLFAPQKGGLVEASSSYSKEQTEFKTINNGFTSSSDEYSFYLYDDNQDNQNYFDVKVSDSSASVTGSPTVSIESKKIYVSSSTTIIGSNDNQVQTKLYLSDEMYNLKDYYTLSFNAKVYADNKNNQKVKVEWGEFSNEVSSKVQSGKQEQIEIDLSLIGESREIIITFLSEGSGFTNVLHIEDANFLFKKIDINSPVVDLADNPSNWTWSGENSREILFNVIDRESGVKSIRIYDKNNDSVDFTQITSQDSKVNSYSFNALYNNDYYISVCDNLHNEMSYTLINANDLKLDITAGVLTINQIDTLHSGKLDVKFNYVSDNKSDETLYYAIVSESDYDENNIISTTNYDGKASVDLLDSAMSIPFGSIIPNAMDNTNYIISAVVIDSVGNVSNTIKQTFIYDSRRFVVDISLDGGSLSGDISGADILSELFEIKPHAWAGSLVGFSYTPSEGYEFYEIRRYELAKDESGNLITDDNGEYVRIGNGQVMSATTISTGYKYSCNNNYAFVIKFRYRVQISISNDTMVYDAKENGEGVTQSIDFTLNDDGLDGSIDKSIIEFTYLLNGVEVSSLKDAGTYIIQWKIDNDNRDYVGSGTASVTINPKPVTLAYSNLSNLVYNGNVQNIVAEVNDDTLNDSEKALLDLVTKYYLSSDGTYSTAVELKNAGSYTAITSAGNKNYLVTNSIVNDIIVAKKTVSMNVLKSEFDYNADIQMLEYSLSYDIDTLVKYYLDVENTNEVEFKNAGEYNYIVSPVDSDNYELTQNTGSAVINKVNAYFSLNKTKYDYTGNVLSLEDIKFVILSSEEDNSKEIVVNGLTLLVYDMDNNEAILKDPDTTYKIIFTTSDTNYNLFNTEFTVEIETTQIQIIVTNEYEYTGETITFNYETRNQNNELLNISGLTYTITKDNEPVDSIIDTGIYSYIFTADDPKFELVDGEGTFEVKVANVTVTIGSLEYTYDKDYGYIVEYLAVSEGGNNYNSKIKIDITKDGEISTLTNIGTYGFSVGLVDDIDLGKIEIVCVLDGNGDEIVDRNITILPKEIEYHIDMDYTYTGSDIILQYYSVNESELSDELVKVEIETLLNAGNYTGTISSLDANYIIKVEGLTRVDGVTTFTVVVNKYKIIILQSDDGLDEYVYIYSGENITPEFNLSLDDYGEYTLIDVNTSVVASIVNAGTYTLRLDSTNTNYEVLGTVLVRVNPKHLDISVDSESLNQIYNKDVKAISYRLLDDNETKNVSSSVKYYIDTEFENEVTPVNAGEYLYVIMITDSNYEGSYTSSSGDKLAIAKKRIVLDIEANQYKVYGDNDNAIRYTLSGICDGDNLEVTLTREEGESVGAYKVNVVNESFDNYEISYEEVYYKIIKKQLLIIADACEKVYGSSDGELSYKMYMNKTLVSKLIGEDKLLGKLERVSGEDIGEYEITIGSLDNPNYKILFSSAIFTIKSFAIDVEIDDVSVVYGESRSLTYSVAEKYATYINGTLERELGDNVGEYAITVGSLGTISNNYTINILHNGVYTITPKSATVVAISQVKEYGEDDDLNYFTIGLNDGDTLNGSLSREEGENVGVYQITLGNLSNENYSIKFVSGTLTILKADLSLVIDNKTQVYGNKSQELTYTIEGLKNNENIDIALYRAGGEDAGVYPILASFSIPSNYSLSTYIAGVYTIERANPVIKLNPKVTTYSGNVCAMTSDSDLPLRYVYKQFGVEVEAPINAGTYRVQAFFDGNNNYNSAVSNETTLVIEEQEVYITLGKTEFIYDGEAKYPLYTYDKKLDLNDYSFEFDFVGGAIPLEEGTYPFTLKIKDGLNYFGSVSGVVAIKKAFAIDGKEGIIECSDATFDDGAQDITLHKSNDTTKFNDEKVLSVYSLKSGNLVNKNNYVYTVKVKAIEGVDSVKVYKVGSSDYTEIAVKIEDGYFVFDVDNLEDKYIITTEIKKLSTLAWILIIVAITLVFATALTIILVVKKKKSVKAKVSQEEIKDYHIM